MMAKQPGFGRLLFDAGLPADSLVSELRLRLKRDLAQDMEVGRVKLLQLVRRLDPRAV